MNTSRQSLDQIKDLLKPYLPQYLTAMGHNTSGLFTCINSDHNDSDPSMGIVPGSNDRIFNCFGCHTTGDIFVAAHLLEGKPLTGHGFVTDNMFYLAHRFGIDVPDMPELTPEDLKEMETYAAYSHAAMIIRSFKREELSQRIQNRLTELLWPEDLRKKLGIGSVKSYEDYINRMTKLYGHKREFLEEIDLTRRAMFNANNLIFTVKDENGAPVGFACRSLTYDEDKTKWAKQVEEIKASFDDENSPECKESLKKIWKPSKYVNTKDSCPIYSKKRLLYNFNEGRKTAPPLWVFEGYPDGATAFMGGLLNSCAIGATAFTEEHIELLLGLKIKHLIFVLDADVEGQNAMERIMGMMESIGGHPGLTVEMVSMPEGTDDPDRFIRSFGSLQRGVAEFRKLPREDMFTWGLKKRIDHGDEPMLIAENIIPTIVNELNNLKRIQMAKKLSQATQLDESFLLKEVQRLVDADLSALDEEKTVLARKLSAEITRNPLGIATTLENYRIKVENVEKRKTGYDPMRVLSNVEFVFERAEKNDRGIELETRYRMLNNVMGGIPQSQAFISVPGKPNQGKSTFLQNLAADLPELNDDTTVFMHSVDDALALAVPRILGAKYQIPSEYFKRPAFWRNQVEDFDRIYYTAREWLREMIGTEKLILADIAILPATLPAYETWVRTIRNKHPNRRLVGMGDNFHLFDLAGYEPGESKTRAMSMFIKRLANQYDATMIFTTELPKESLRAGVRPRIKTIKGTSGVAYDANANFGIYNDLKDMGERATVFWEGPLETVIGPNGEQSFSPRRMPVIELVIDKSKLSGFDGTIYFRLNPDSGHLEECDEAEQARFRAATALYLNSPNSDLGAGSQAPYRSSF